ncbi:hypothetical protein ES702_06343 [subsurface metagenome]
MISNENKILIDNCKCKLIFLFEGAKNTEVKAIPVRYRRELKQLFDELQEYISPEEYKNFVSDLLEIPLKGAVEQAEEIIKNRGQENGE